MAPAPETYPWTFWYWMYGCVSDEGIKLDLEAMHDAGIAGFYLMPIKDTTDGKGYNGTARQLSPEWSEAHGHSIPHGRQSETADGHTLL